MVQNWICNTTFNKLRCHFDLFQKPKLDDLPGEGGGQLGKDGQTGTDPDDPLVVNPRVVNPQTLQHLIDSLENLLELLKLLRNSERVECTPLKVPRLVRE